jgi:hypothetical protein
MAILPKAICIFNTDPIKIPMTFFIELHSSFNPKVHSEVQKTSNTQSNPESKEHAGGITIPDFKL